MKTLAIAALAALTIAATGCATSPNVQVTQLDRKPLSTRLEPQDVREAAAKMVESMLADQEFINQVCGARPVLDVTQIENRTSDRTLDLVSVTDSIRTQLLRSRKFRFMDRKTSGDDLQFMNDQALNGLTDQSKAVRAGQQSAAQMYLYGAVTEMAQKAGRMTDRYFKLTLNMKDLKSGEIVWTDEYEIRKAGTRSAVGI